MEISAVNNSVSSTSVATAKPVPVQPVAVQKTVTKTNESVVSIVKNKENSQGSKMSNDGEKQPSERELTNMTEQLNDFMQAINTDLRFVLHARTNQLIVQVEDSKHNKVLKEYPAHELLDMVARIRDYVGGLFDKNA